MSQLPLSTAQPTAATWPPFGPTDTEARFVELATSLLRKRVIVIAGEINDDMANMVSLAMLAMRLQGKDPIHLYVNSFGGSVYAGFAIIDAIRLAQSEGVVVQTTVHGAAMSMASVIAACGSGGHRSITPLSTTMVHQVSSGGNDRLDDLGVSYHEARRLDNVIVGLYAEATGFDVETMIQLMHNGNLYLNAEETVRLGLADNVIGTPLPRVIADRLQRVPDPSSPRLITLPIAPRRVAPAATIALPEPQSPTHPAITSPAATAGSGPETSESSSAPGTDIAL